MASKMKYTRNESKSLIPSFRLVYVRTIGHVQDGVKVWDTSYEVTYMSIGDQHESKASASEVSPSITDFILPVRL